MKPILFSTAMVRKILKGEKTQTRRVIEVRKPYKVGEILWVRETWANKSGFSNAVHPYLYKADYPESGIGNAKGFGKWKPSIHMPKAAARLFLEVLSVNKEQLQDITHEDAEKEGCYCIYENAIPYQHLKNQSFQSLWDSIYAKRGYSWNSNPRVYKYTFQVVDKPQESEGEVKDG